MTPIEAAEAAIEALAVGRDYAEGERFENAQRYKGHEHLAPDDAAAVAQIDAAVAALRAALPALREAGDRWVVVRESALDVGQGDDVRTGGRPELGYALLADTATFASEDEARAALQSAGLPLGWVLMPLRRLLPDLYAAPPAPSVREVEPVAGADPWSVDRPAVLAWLDARGLPLTVENAWRARTAIAAPPAPAQPAQGGGVVKCDDGNDPPSFCELCHPTTPAPAAPDEPGAGVVEALLKIADEIEGGAFSDPAGLLGKKLDELRSIASALAAQTDGRTE